MRRDLNKLLCERERRGGARMSYRTVRRSKKSALDLDPEGSNATRQGMARPYGYESKEFNENLNPLKGAIRKAVGRKWDRFYSDLCSVFDRRSVINQHIVQHLYDFIEKDVLVKDGKFYVRGKYGMTARPLSESSAEFYVDPKTGIIRVNKRRITYRQAQRKRAAAQAAEEAKVTRRIDEHTVLHLIDDTWFVFELKPIPAEGEVFDAFKREWVARQRWGANVYHTARRTASRKTLKEVLG
jgi:hypothetical protein